MSDPVRHKNLAVIKATVKLKPTGEITNIYSRVDQTVLKNTPQSVIEETIKENLKKISEKPNTVIYGFSTAFSYAEKGGMKDFDFGNVFVEANLPYCLHLPNNTEVLISIPENDIKALVIIDKIWTNRAQTEDGKSDIVDFYAEKNNLFFHTSTTLSPRIPFSPEEGWEPFITGKNIEKINDQNGIFRYSRVYIQLNLGIPEKINEITNKLREGILKEIQDKSLLVVNRLIDNYRELTKEIHVRRLGKITANMIYILPQDAGFYIVNCNTTSAMINRSLNEIKQLKKQLKLGIKPDLYKLLFLNAKNSFDSGDYTLAIVESFQALEIFLENFLIAEFIKKGIDEKEYKEKLDKYWRTKERLNIILKEFKGIGANSNKNVWGTWCLHYDKTRNDVLHSGKEPNLEETKETLAINENLINWILSL